MISPLLAAIGTLLALLPATLIPRTAGEALRLRPQSRLWVTGNSTVRSWTCRAPSFETSVDAAPGAIPAVLGAQKAVRTVVVTVPAAKMACGNGTMDEHMWKALRTRDNPVIEFRLGSYDVTRGAEGVTGTLNGTLSLGGAQRPVVIAAQGADADGALHVTGSTTIHMKDFGLKPPTLMMGTLRVDEKVVVHFDLVLGS